MGVYLSPNNNYDDIDMRNNYNRGFWLGASAGVFVTFLLCLIVGIFA